MNNLKLSIRIIVAAIVLGSASLPMSVFGQEILASSGRESLRVAPGENLSFSIKLLNFGAESRADVVVTYRIDNATHMSVYESQESVAVETTAGFVKHLPLPHDVPPGMYTMTSEVLYRGQTDPAKSSFSFAVEPKLFGIFRSDLIKYAVIGIGVFGMSAFFTRFLIRRSSRRFITYDYSNQPLRERVYYEIISDAIAGMRVHAGDDALAVAGAVPELTIDPHTGRVIEIGRHPEKILASLVLRYETLLGRGIHVSRRRNS